MVTAEVAETVVATDEGDGRCGGYGGSGSGE